MATFNSEVKSWIKRNNLIEDGDHVICAVSGGVDSIVLLHVLHSIKDELGIKVSAAHFNHNIRGEESDRDEEFVRNYCKENGITFYCGSGDVMGRVAELHESVEEAARNLRYEFLESIDKNAKIATAHHANDNLETILMNMIRGTATGGLAGIPLVRGNIIRPLMCMTREELEEYAEQNGISHVEDSTNASNDYLRNRVRHNIIPLLLAENPEMLKGMVKTASSVRDDTKYLNDKADKVFKDAKFTGEFDQSLITSSYDVDKLHVDSPIQSRVMLRIMESLGVSYSSKNIDDLIKCIESNKAVYKVNLPNGYTAVKDHNRLNFISHYTSSISMNPVKLNCPGETDVKQLGVKVVINLIENITEISKDNNRLYICINSVNGDLYIRPKKDGDKIKAPGGTNSVGKYLKAKGVPEYTRNKYPIIEDEKGLVCVPGYGIDMTRKCRIGDTVLEIKLEKLRLG